MTTGRINQVFDVLAPRISERQTTSTIGTEWVVNRSFNTCVQRPKGRPLKVSSGEATHTLVISLASKAIQGPHGGHENKWTRYRDIKRMCTDPTLPPTQAVKSRVGNNRTGAHLETWFGRVEKQGHHRE